MWQLVASTPKLRQKHSTGFSSLFWQRPLPKALPQTGSISASPSAHIQQAAFFPVLRLPSTPPAMEAFRRVARSNRLFPVYRRRKSSEFFTKRKSRADISPATLAVGFFCRTKLVELPDRAKLFPSVLVVCTLVWLWWCAPLKGGLPTLPHTTQHRTPIL